MSVVVDGNYITATRGDTIELKVGIQIDGEEYMPQDGDVVRFAVKHKKMNADKTEYLDPEPLIEITIPNDTMTLTVEPQDTKPLGFGNYDYDVQITFANGRVDTFISDTLKLTKEVE